MKEYINYYKNQYLNFLKKVGKTRISANEWIGSSISSNYKKTKNSNKNQIKKW